MMAELPVHAHSFSRCLDTVQLLAIRPNVLEILVWFMSWKIFICFYTSFTIKTKVLAVSFVEFRAQIAYNSETETADFESRRRLCLPASSSFMKCNNVDYV